MTVQFADGAIETVELLVARRRGLTVTVLPECASYSGYVAWRGMVPEHLLRRRWWRGLADAITYFVSRTAILLYPIPAADGSVTPGEFDQLRLVSQLPGRRRPRGC